MSRLAALLTPAVIAAGDPPKPPSVSNGNPYSTFYSAAITDLQYGIAVAVLSIVALGLLAGYIYTARARRQVGPQYQAPLFYGRVVLLMATASYLVLLGKYLFGYMHAITPQGIGVFVPTQAALLNTPIRYVDWAITVPLLVLQLLTISSLRATDRSGIRTWGMLAAFLMIVCGYIGGVAIDNGHDLGARLLWGGISSVFFLILYGIIIHAMRESAKELTPAASSRYRRATFLLMGTWFIYPIVYVLTGFHSTPNWIIGYQVALGVADLVAKVGFSILVIRVAQIRTAADDLPIMIEAEKQAASADQSN